MAKVEQHLFDFQIITIVAHQGSVIEPIVRPVY